MQSATLLGIVRVVGTMSLMVTITCTTWWKPRQKTEVVASSRCNGDCFSISYLFLVEGVVVVSVVIDGALLLMWHAHDNYI